MIDLDHNATTKPSDAVIARVVHTLEHAWHNPSSVHRAGQEARAIVELARQDIARLLGVQSRQIIFTSSGTEAIDLAIRGWIAALPAGVTPRIVTSRIEHSAVRDLVAELERSSIESSLNESSLTESSLTESKRVEVVWLDMAQTPTQGVYDPALLEDALTQADGSSRNTATRRRTLVIAQWANNETGFLQPIDKLYDVCTRHNATLLCDATQWVGKLPIVWPMSQKANPAAIATGSSGPTCDMLVCSPHKFHGLKGAGVLWLSQKARIRPQTLGTQELGRRGGTEGVPAIAGAGVAAREAIVWLLITSEREQLELLRDAFEAKIVEGVNASVPMGWPKARVHGVLQNGEGVARLWNTTNIAFPRLEAEAILLALSERGVNASAGAACSSGSLDPSPVLLAMGVPAEFAHGSVRFSLAKTTTKAELDEAAAIVIESVLRLIGSMPGIEKRY